MKQRLPGGGCGFISPSASGTCRRHPNRPVARRRRCRRRPQRRYGLRERVRRVRAAGTCGLPRARSAAAPLVLVLVLVLVLPSSSAPSSSGRGGIGQETGGGVLRVDKDVKLFREYFDLPDRYEDMSPLVVPRYVSLSLSLSLCLSLSLSLCVCLATSLPRSVSRFCLTCNSCLAARIYLSIHPSVRPSVRPSIHSSFCSSCFALSLSMCMCARLLGRPTDCSGATRRTISTERPRTRPSGARLWSPSRRSAAGTLHGGGGHRPLRRGLYHQHVQRASRGASGTQNDRAFLQSITSFIHPPIHPSIRVSIHPSIHPLCFILAVINHTHPALSAPCFACVNSSMN